MNPFRISRIDIPAAHRRFIPAPHYQPQPADPPVDCSAGFTFAALFRDRSREADEANEASGLAHIGPDRSPPLLRGLPANPTARQIADAFPLNGTIRSVIPTGRGLVIGTTLDYCNRRPVIVSAYLKLWGGRTVASVHDAGVVLNQSQWPEDWRHLVGRNMLAGERITHWTVDPSGRLVLADVPLSRLAELAIDFARDMQAVDRRLQGLMRAGRRGREKPHDRLRAFQAL